MTDIRERLEKGRCKEGHGCNVATMCMCALVEDAVEEIERLRAQIAFAKSDVIKARDTLDTAIERLINIEIGKP